MKIKTKDLTGEALNWAVGVADGVEVKLENLLSADGFRVVTAHGWTANGYDPSDSWSLAGPIIEREGMQIQTFMDKWLASIPRPFVQQDGPTPLIAAMRCYVASKLGGTVDIPEELA
jgi:hypothetical protein